MKKFLTDSQIELLQAQKWDIVPDGAYINLYPTDFENGTIWEDICDQLQVSAYNTDSIQVLYFAKKVNESKKH